MKKKDELVLYQELERCMQKLEDIYKLSNLIKKFCDLNKDSDDLYEVSSVIDITVDMINDVSRDLYHSIHKHDITPILQNFGPRISRAL